MAKNVSVIQHLFTGNHKSAVARTNSLENNQILISNTTSKSPFFQDMCNAMVLASMPLKSIFFFFCIFFVLKNILLQNKSITILIF